jgi:outer membrane protein assembly factor BamB
VDTGAELWVHAWPGLFQEWMGGDGPRSTPTWHEGKVYGLGALGELRCFDAATGELVWRRNLREDNRAPQLTYGFAGSPLIVDDLVVVQAGGSNGGSVVAYHRLTGEPVWKSLDDPAAYSSPMVVELAGERQLLVVTGSRAVGLAVETGALLWEFPWKVLQGNRNIAQPVVLGANRFFLSAGYGTGCVAVEVARTEEGFSARETWRNTNMKNKFTSSVLWEGHLYGLDESILVCLDAETGERKWKDGRYGYGQLVLANGHLIVLAGDGDLALVKAAPERHMELARFPAIAGKTWNHPALAGGRLFVRNSAEMACFDLIPPKGVSQ